MTGEIDYAKILKMKADIDRSTPESPCIIKEDVLTTLKSIKPSRYAEAVEMIKSGACILVI